MPVRTTLPWPAILLIALSSGCAAGLVLGESAMEDCSRGPYDDLDGKEYRLIRVAGGESSERPFVFRVRKNCALDFERDLSPLGVTAMEITNSRKAKGALVVLTTDRQDKAGKPVTCSAAFEEEGPLHFRCGDGAGGTAADLSYALEPVPEAADPVP